jgi:integrase
MSQGRALLTHKALLPRAFFIVPYLTPDEVARMGQACQGRHQARDELLILTLFQTGLRISEVLSITPRKIGSFAGGAVLHIEGKGQKPRLVACPHELYQNLS